MSPLRPSDPLRDHPLPVHDDDATKQDRGTVLIVAGSAQTPGAAVLAGTAALRAGAGKLKIATAAASCAGIGVAVPESRVMPLDDRDALLEAVGQVDAVVVGPGLLDEDAELVKPIAAAVRDATLVVDAGSLGCLSESVPPRTILMPNPDEVDDRFFELGAVVAVRGAESTITASDGTAYTDSAGTVGLATSGSGDVVAGLIGGFAARGADPLTAALWGVRVHGVAGERLGDRVGAVGFLARELLAEVPLVLRDLAAQ